MGSSFVIADDLAADSRAATGEEEDIGGRVIGAVVDGGGEGVCFCEAGLRLRDNIRESERKLAEGAREAMGMGLNLLADWLGR